MVRSMRWRHAVLGAVVLVLAGLAFAGCLGPAVGPERIAAYDVVAQIRPDRTVAIREVIDWDFGGDERHGIFRTIPATGGAPDAIEVSSPTAPDQFTETSMGGETEIKIGDPDRTISGRHRYVITYVLPAVIDGDLLALDAIGDEWPVGSDHVTVTLIGAQLDDTGCFTGPLGSDEECAIEEVDGGYRVEADDLEAREAITVQGFVGEITEAAVPPAPPFVDRDGSDRIGWAGIVAGLGLLTAAVVYLGCRLLGRNEVAGGGATEAAFATGAFGPDGTRLVPDDEMGELAGLDFVPPRDVEPWQAAVVLREKIDSRTVGAWFSSLAGHDIVTMDGGGSSGSLALRPGPRAAEADAVVAPILNQALGDRDEVRLGTYDARFATAWGQAGRAIEAWTASAGVFRRRPPRYGVRSAGGLPGWVSCVVPAVFAVGAGGSALATGLRSGVAAVVVTVAVVGALALVCYSVLTRGLTAAGSAIALRSESFRRFLHDSEAQHVEWAWQHGLLREYSAWAVALGEADAWNRALSASSVPPPEITSNSNVLVPALYASSFSSTTTAPQTSSSSSGGSSSFSGGGFSGGGGGGGGGGSW